MPADSCRSTDERELQLPPIQTWTLAQRDYFEQYMCEMADALRLSDIEVFFEWGKSIGKDLSAQANVTLARNRLRIALSEDLPHQPPEDARDTVVHELLHYHTARLRQAIMRVEEDLHGHVYLALAKMIDVDEEQMVDALARVIAPNLPLPEWPRDDESTGGGPAV